MIFGYRFIREDELLEKDLLVAQSRDRIKVLESLSEEQRHQIALLRQKSDEEKLKDIMDIDIGDPTPDNPDARKAYVGRVAGFYKDVLEKKCLQMISVFHKLLEEETNDKQTDNILKIGIYVCREWMKWGVGAVNEQLSYQTENLKEEVITQK